MPSSLRAKKGKFKERVKGLSDELEVDTRQLGKALNRLFNFLDATEEQMETHMDHAALELHKAIKEDTPEDTGTARAGWGTFPKRRMWGAQKTWIISNWVKYIVYLEYGWSKKAPHGMIRRNIRKLKQYISRNLLADSAKKAEKS